MSDHDTAPDPIDTAYVLSQSMLSDDAERAARRARVLAAIAREPIAPSATRRPAGRNFGWLAAAGVVGAGVFVASQIYRPIPRPPAPAPAPVVTPAPPVPKLSPAPGPTAPTPTPAPKADRATPAIAHPAPTRRDEPVVPLSPPLFIKPVPPPPPPPPPAPMFVEAPKPMAPAPPVLAAPAPPPPRPTIVNPSARDESKAYAYPPSGDAARLRAAAGAGRTAEVESLLAQGAPVDAADAEGDTALMKAIEADRPAAAALLRRHGASLDRRNHAGQSARDLAAATGDADLNDALGLGP